LRTKLQEKKGTSAFKEQSLIVQKMVQRISEIEKIKQSSFEVKKNDRKNSLQALESQLK
jgi:hypothetical protein